MGVTAQKCDVALLNNTHFGHFFFIILKSLKASGYSLHLYVLLLLFKLQPLKKIMGKLLFKPFFERRGIRVTESFVLCALSMRDLKVKCDPWDGSSQRICVSFYVVVPSSNPLYIAQKLQASTFYWRHWHFNPSSLTFYFLHLRGSVCIMMTWHRVIDTFLLAWLFV